MLVFAFVLSFQAGYLTTKGESALGTSFRAGSFPQNGNNDSKNFFVSVMASEDNTTVTFSDFDNEVVFAGNNAPNGNTVTVTLDENESYVLSGYTTSMGNYEGFIGALISADKPIAVNSGNALGGEGSNLMDYTIDQIVPISEIGWNMLW